MLIHDSRIVTDMGPEHYRLTPQTDVEIVGPVDFIDRYVDTVALNDTVRRSMDVRGARVMRVEPWDMAAREADYEARVSAFPDLAPEFKYPKPPVGVIPRDEAQQEVAWQLKAHENARLLDALPPLERCKQMAAFLLKRESLFVPRYKHLQMLPNVLVVYGPDATAQQIVIDKEAENEY